MQAEAQEEVGARKRWDGSGCESEEVAAVAQRLHPVEPAEAGCAYGSAEVCT